MQELLDRLSGRLANQVVTEEESLEVGQCFENLEDMVGTSATNTIVLQAERLQTLLIAQHVSEVGHGIIV